MRSTYKMLIAVMVTAAFFSSCKHDPIPGPNNPNSNDSTNNQQPVDTANPSFANVILPIFIANCSGCHNDSNPSDGYNFTTYEKIKAKKFVAGNLNDTKLYKSIIDDDDDDRMPQAPNPRLSEVKILLIKNWILNGAPNN